MINVSNNYKTALTQPRQIDAKITYNSTTITSDNINSIKRSFNSDLFKTIAKMVDIDSNTTIAKDTTINPQFGLYINSAFEYVSLGSYKVKDTPILNKDTNSYQIIAYDKIVESMVSYELIESDITYPCNVRQLFVAIFTKLGWATSGIPNSFTNSTSSIEEDVYSNVNMTYRDVLDELCTISCMFLIDVNGTPTLKQKTTTSETINEEYMSDKNVEIGNQVFFNSLVFSRSANSDNIYRKDDTSITNNGLHEFKASDLQILSLNWRDNFIDAMWNYIKTFNYYAFDINTIGITYLEPIDTFTLSTFGSTYATILLNSDLTIANGVNEKIYSTEPNESETEYKYADTTDKRINQTNLIVNKQQGEITALVSQVDEIEQDIQNPTSTKQGTSIDITDALDSPLIDFKMYGDTQQDSEPTPSTPQPIQVVTGRNDINVCGKNLFDKSNIETGKYYYASGTNTSTNWAISQVKVQPSTNYYLSGNTYNNDSAKIVLLDKSKNIIQDLGGYKNVHSITTTSNTAYIGLSIAIYSGATDIDTIQLEKGSSSSTYETYTGYTQEINLGSIELCKISTYQDYIYKTNDKWYIHKEIGKYVYNNDLQDNGSETNYLKILTPVLNIAPNLDLSSLSLIARCNLMTSKFDYANSNYTGLAGTSSTNKIRVYINKTYANDFASASTLFANNNLTIYYVLAEATETEITNSELVGQLDNLMANPLLKGLNHITNETFNLYPNLFIEYFRDTSLNENFVSKEDMTKYYTKTETDAQILINSSSIQQSVSELQNTTNSNTGAITTLSNQINTLQTSTSLRIDAINEQLEDGVSKVKTTTGYTFDNNGMSITKNQGFKLLATDRYQEITYNDKELSFMGFDDTLNKPIARIEELEARKITTGVHRTETIEEDNEYWTAQYYVGGAR